MNPISSFIDKLDLIAFSKLGIVICLMYVSTAAAGADCGSGKADCNQEQHQTEAQNQTLTPALSPTPTASKKPQAAGVTFKRVFLNLPGDQKAIWTSPFHIRATDAAWLVPLGATTGVLIGSDQHSMARAQSNIDAINHSNTIADAGLIGFAAVPAAMYVWGSLEGSARPRETGLLAGEALMNSVAVNLAFKYAFQRERPTPTGGQGRFF